MKAAFYLFVLLACLQSTAVAQGGKVALKLGDQAPSFSLPDGDGKMVSLSDFLAKGPVVVIFYRGFW